MKCASLSVFALVMSVNFAKAEPCAALRDACLQNPRALKSNCENAYNSSQRTGNLFALKASAES